MVRLVTDNDFNGKIARGFLRLRPTADLVRVQDLGMAEIPDPDLLEWAARNDRIVATRDHNTMIGFARARVAAGRPMPGLFVVDHQAPIGRTIDTLVLIEDESQHGDWTNRIEFLPW